MSNKHIVDAYILNFSTSFNLSYCLLGCFLGLKFFAFQRYTFATLFWLKKLLPAWFSVFVGYLIAITLNLTSRFRKIWWKYQTGFTCDFFRIKIYIRLRWDLKLTWWRFTFYILSKSHHVCQPSHLMVGSWLRVFLKVWNWFIGLQGCN